MMPRLSLTFRLTFLFVSGSAVLLLGFGVLISSLVDRHFEELDVEVLSGKIELVQHALAQVRSADDLAKYPKQFDEALVGHPGLALVVLDADGKTQYAANGEEFPAPLLAQIRASHQLPVTLGSGPRGKPYRAIAATVPLGTADARPATVAVAMDVSHHQHFIATFETALWTIVAGAWLISVVLGRFTVRRVLAPLRAIKQGAAGVTANRLDYRIDPKSVPVEMEELANTLNTMLARLEESFQRLSDFSSDIAHELRTPVSNMLMQTQVILSRPRSADEYKEVLHSNAEEFARLSRMIADMLFLAKTDHGLVAPFEETVDLAHEIEDLFSFFEVLAETRNVQLVLQGEGSVIGDRSLLRRAISNLLSNAIRHASESGEVRAELTEDKERDEVRLAIANTGEPIPDEHLSRVFDRFYRANAARENTSENIGLGLAITKSIVHLHGGSIDAACRDGITRFEMRLPRHSNPARIRYNDSRTTADLT